MKSIALVLLVLGVAYADRFRSSWPIRFGMCAKPAISTDFRINDFFTKKWYNWRSYGNVLFAHRGSCQGMEAEVDGDKINLLVFKYEPLFGNFRRVKGETIVEYTKIEGLNFPVTFDLFGEHKFTMALTILGTDYDNWAVVYFCHQGLGLKIEMAWVMVRDWEAEVTPAVQVHITDALDKVGLDFSQFQTQDNTHCGKGEPHL